MDSWKYLNVIVGSGSLSVGISVPLVVLFLWIACVWQNDFAILRRRWSKTVVKSTTGDGRHEKPRDGARSKTCKMPLKVYDVLLQLKLPDHVIVSTGIPSGYPVSPSQVQLESNIETNKVAGEETDIDLLFPHVRSDNLRICMAAWLGALYRIEGIIRDIESTVAVAALQDSITILSNQNKAAESRPSNPSYGTDVPYIVSALRDHCMQYLNPPVAHVFLAEVSSVCQSLLRALQYRQGETPNTDLTTYLRIRTRSIGISPLFVLVRSLHPPKNATLSILLELERLVARAAGLQKDLVRLETDLQTGDTMNAVLVALRDSDRDTADKDALRDAIATVCRIHDECITSIIDVLEIHSKRAGATGADEVLCAHAIVAFVEGHIKWCALTQGYQLDSE